jgi:2-polyprenyl-6-methoxyphenol hydroxylase-like FAD-dependent oxidoreductase
MTARRVLISGASIAGLSAAFWLGRTGWEVTVLERFPSLRAGGQNVDVRGAARAVLTRMQLEDAVRRCTTTEEGTSIVDDRGHVIGAFPVEEANGPTAELEILRGDLARVLHDALPDSVKLRYDDHITRVQNRSDGVTVTLDSGSEEDWDLLLIAEGVRSATRRMVFGSNVTHREIGLNMVYGTIPRTSTDDRWWRWYVMPGGRQVTLRPDNVGTTRATLAFTSTQQNIAELDLDQARTALRRVFKGGKWDTKRVVDGFAASEDVYMDYLTQIDMPTWSTGRVAVTGDAAWCVTPLGGGGASLALTGAYVLAAYLSQYPNDILTAMTQYERWMRPLTKDAQQLPPGTPNLFYPDSRLGVAVWRTFARVGSIKPLRKITTRLSHVVETDQHLPDMRSTDR